MRNGRLLIAVTLGLSTLAGCSHAVRNTTPPSSPQANRATQAAVENTPQAVHKGNIDISNGLYIREDDDLIVPAAIPLVLRRTYLSGDSKSRHFGIGATHPGEWYLHGDDDPTLPWAQLILADGGRIHFTRVSGTAWFNAVLRHDVTPTRFAGASLKWDGSRWIMEFRDGSAVWFKPCETAKEVCSIVEERDARGNRVAYERDETGRLISMSTDGQRLSFEYDAQRRITAARDTRGNSVAYSYDDLGRLVLAKTSTGVARRYEYNARNELTVIHDPHRVVANWFDDSGRVVRQEVRSSDADPDPYVMSFAYTVANGNVLQTDITEDDGTRSTYHFNPSHYVLSETMDADGPSPVTFTYDRDASNVAGSVRLSCGSPSAPTTYTVRSPVMTLSTLDDDAKEALVRAHCAPSR